MNIPKPATEEIILEDIVFFEPEIKNLIWGDEYWTISAHDHGDVTVKEGRFKGLTLSQLWIKHPELFGAAAVGDRFPLLVKIIATREDLSIQVHPDDDYAAIHENGSLGKTECWYILDCEDESRLVFGHNAKNRDELETLIANNRYDELLCEIPIKNGDFIQMNPGTVHAIKGGIRLLEIQQSSDITYRLYDYNRTTDGLPRPLHVRQALDVIKCPAPSAADSVIPATSSEENEVRELERCDYYVISTLDVKGTFSLTQDFPFLIICVIEGEGYIGEQSLRVDDHILLPNGYSTSGNGGEIRLSGEMRLILATVPSGV
ncbi:MAG: mannose-6-phosphate isomerase [Lachnospiraceae bacterium]|jgi:beta-glucosidase|nr:mannose-6-phosphate isomerase [Lachnospiraceae bacterium]